MDGPRLLSGGATSLLNLKAELHRKQEAYKLDKLQQKQKPISRISFKGQTEKIKRKKKSEDIDTSIKVVQCDPEEEEMLKKSRLSLEAKARLYDGIINNEVEIDDEMEENYLVDFHRKEKFDLCGKVNEANVSSSTDDPQVVQDMQDLPDPGVVNHFNNKTKVAFVSGKESFFPPTSNFDLKVSDEEAKQELSHDKDNVSGERPLHYQNVLYNEVRDHGVGYFSFSKDEKKRQEQMEALNSLHEKAKESRQSKQKMEQKRAALLQSRLARVCQRRNIDKSVLDSIIEKPKEIEIEAEDLRNSEKNSTEDSASASDANTTKSSSSQKVRPWDVGKSHDGFQNPNFLKRKSSEKSWIESQRDERIEEFAPPALYFNSN